MPGELYQIEITIYEIKYRYALLGTVLYFFKEIIVIIVALVGPTVTKKKYIYIINEKQNKVN